MQTQPINNPITGTTRKIPISFKGYKSIIDNKGKEFIGFYAPAYDRSRYNLSLQTAAVELDEKSDWVPVKDEESLKHSKSSAAFEEQGVFYVSKAFLNGRGILTFDSKGKEKGLGYQFVLTPKEGGDAISVQEAGVKTSDGKYNVISANNGLTPRSGTMYHAFLNSLNPSKEAKEAKATRTHFNDFGTTIQGVRDLLKKGIFDSYTYILSTPVTGKMHGYWCENLFQVYPSIGTMEDFGGLQTDSFDRGISWINDGTFTAMGIKSPQFQHVLKWGKASPYYNWFKMGGGKTELGILPAASADGVSAKGNEGRKHIKYTVINAPNKKDYDSAKPTYIQFYDDRLVDNPPTDIMDNYPKFNTKDRYEIKTHQDSVVPNYFEINPDRTNMEALVAHEGTPLSDVEDVGKLFNFGEFVVVDKKDAKGMNNWDGNPEIVKMNLSNPSESIIGNEIGNAQVRNFLYQVGSYWTGTCADALLEHNAKNLVKDKEGTLKAIGSNFGVNLDGVAANIEDGSWVSQFLKSSEKQSADEFLLRQIAQYPLEAIELGNDLSSVLGSPYITMRPVMAEHQTLTRYDMIKESYTPQDIYGNTVKTDKSYAAYMAEELPEEEAAIVRDFLPASEQMNLTYRNQIKNFVNAALKEIDNFNKQNGKLGEENLIYKDSDKNELTPYGRYVAKILTPEIVKFAVVSALFGNDSIEFDGDTGAIKYNYESLRKKGIRDLGIKEKSPKQTAEAVVEKIAKGMEANLEGTYYKSLASVFAKRLDGTTLKDFKTSEAIIQQTKSGLNWRFDATKDVADLETRRNYKVTFEKCWDDVVEFWGNFMKAVKEQNPASYSIAEITDLWSFNDGVYKMSNAAKAPKDEGSDFGKYKNPETAIRMLLEKTGITTFTNYNYLFSSIVPIFSRDFEYGDFRGDLESLRKTFGNFLQDLPLTAITCAHNMMSNHDKLRPMHLLSLNVALFIKNNPEPSEGGVVKDVVGEKYPINLLSAKAIAVGQAFDKYFDKNSDIGPDTRAYLKRAVAILALGKTTESDEEKPDFSRAEAFGIKDFSITLNDVVDIAVKLAQSEGKELLYGKDSDKLNLKEDADKEAFVDYAQEEITKVGRAKYDKIWMMYQGLGGNATLYNGDEYAQSGYESAAKNFHLGNREIINHDVVKNPRRADTAEYNKKINEESVLHKRKELSALADGTPIPWGGKYFVVYKNNDKGSEVITVNTDKNISRDWDSPVKNFTTAYERRIKLGLGGGITEGTKFKKLRYDKAAGTYINAKDKYYLNEGESPHPEYFGTEEEYIIRYDGDQKAYYLERIMHNKEGYHHSQDVEIDDNTVIFYKPQGADNRGTIPFKGNPHVALANLRYNIPV